MALEHFGHNQHEVLLHQLFRIRWTGTVAVCIDKFIELMDQLLAYDSVQDPLYYTMHFSDGFCDDICATISVQRPSDLDTTSVLAQLQEDLSKPYWKEEFRKPRFYAAPTSISKGSLPLPLTPRPDKPVLGTWAISRPSRILLYFCCQSVAF